MEFDLDYIINVILSDIAIFDVIPSDSMADKADYARQALKNHKEYEIRFGRYQGEKYTFAVYVEECDQWWDITGHYHGKPPDYAVHEYMERKIKYTNTKKAEIRAMLIARIRLGLSDDINDIGDYYENYYRIRKPIPRICELCGKKETKAKHNFHHIDESLRHNMLDKKDKMTIINPLDNFDEYVDAMTEYLDARLKYYTEDLSQTILLCSKCHAGVHSGKIDLQKEMK